MRLSNSLFVQNNMANNTQNNKLAKNIPHFTGEQSQYATTPPGLTRAYAGVKPSFKGHMEEINVFLSSIAKKDPKESPCYTAIKAVIKDECEALCVWMHSHEPGGERVISEETFKHAHIKNSTFIVAKNAITMAKLQARSQASESALKKVEDNLASLLREELSKSFKKFKSHAPAVQSEPFVPAAPAPASLSVANQKALKSFLSSKRPENSPSFHDIGEVIPDESEALCVWLHSLDQYGINRTVTKKSLNEANLHDSTFEVAKSAIIKAESGNVNPEKLTKVKDNLVAQLRKALDLPHRESLEKRMYSGSQHDEKLSKKTRIS